MSSLSRQWRLLDNCSLSKPDYHYFAQPFMLDNIQGSFAVLSEALPCSTEIQSNAFRRDIGARLATEAAEFAFIELLDKKLNFAKMFFSLFSKHWQATVLLHAIENSSDNSVDLLVGTLNENKQINGIQKGVLEHYDPSIALFYQFDKQLILLQFGYAQVALLNRRYHSEIKKTSQLSLSNSLPNLKNNAEPQLQIIDIEASQIEMVALLSQQYTRSKTDARLSTNIIKLYRQLDCDKKLNHPSDNDNLIILKQEPQTIDSSVTVNLQVDSEENRAVEDKSKKKLASTFFSLLALISGTTASYYLWQAQATETGLSRSTVGQPQHDKTFEDKKIPATTDQEQIQIKNTPFLEQQKFKKQQEKKQQLATKVQEEQAKLARIEAEKNAHTKQLAEATLKRRQKKQAYAEAEKQQLIIKAKEDELERQKEQRLKEKKQEQANLLEPKQREKIALLSIEKDIELITRNEIKTSTPNNFQKIENQQQVQKKREKKARFDAKKKAEKSRLEALVKQRREEFEKNKAQKEKQAMQTRTVEALPPESRKQQQLQTQRDIKKQVDEKKRNVLAELKKQQQKQTKAKELRAQSTQKTAVHQLVNYSKSFNRHVVQLKQKLDARATLNQQADAFTNPKIIHKRALLKTREVTSRKNLESVAKLYSIKIKKLCRASKMYPVTLSGVTQVERIARSLIALQLRNCSRPNFLSTKFITTRLLNKYLK